MLQMDFTENFICYCVDEVQSAYWNSTAVTLHHIVAYFKDQCTERSTSSMSQMIWVTMLVQSLLFYKKQLINELKETLTNGVQMMYY